MTRFVHAAPITPHHTIQISEGKEGCVTPNLFPLTNFFFFFLSFLHQLTGWVIKATNGFMTYACISGFAFFGAAKIEAIKTYTKKPAL
jgi:hypothetical protein